MTGMCRAFEQLSHISFVLLLFAIPGLCSKTYYVTPHPDTPCPAQPCLTLSQYVKETDNYFTSNTTFVFLAGEHSLSADLTLKDVSNVTLTGDNGLLPQVISKVKCARPVNIKFEATSAIKVTALAFTSCGKEFSNFGALHLSATQDFLLSDCILHDNAFTALSVDQSSLTLNKVAFESNSQSALKIFNSTVNSICDSSFSNNSGVLGSAISIVDSTVNFTGTNIFVQNSASNSGGGGGVYAANTTLRFDGNCTFINNSAEMGGGIYAQEGNTINFDGNCCFINNSAEMGGGLMGTTSNITMSFDGNCSFISNSASYYGGGIYAADSTMSIDGNCSFINNSASHDGGGIYLGGEMLTTTSFNGDSRFINNSARYGGGIAVTHNTTVNFDGQCSFIRNLAMLYGGGIFGQSTTLNFYGLSSFISNSATYGGGIALDTSMFYLFQQRGSRMHFTGNYALRGGAISVVDSPHQLSLNCLTVPFLSARKCFFQIQNLSAHYPIGIPKKSLNISLVFEDNSAMEAGDDLYGGTIDSCNTEPLLQTAYKNITGELIDSLAPGLNEERISAISSAPIKVCICDGTGYPDCDREISVTTHPGESFTLTAVAVGQRDGTVPTVIQSIFEKGSTANLRDDENLQSSSKTCTALNYTVFSNASFEKMNVYAKGPCGPDFGQALYILVKLQPCPDGFELSQTTRSCICEKRLQTYTNTCDINSETISRDGDFWVGYDKDTGGLILHPHCPLDYCTSAAVKFTLNDIDLQCNYNRSGLLCGDCQHGLSLVLGTSRCRECSDAYLALLIVFAIAGLLLVFFLLICKLTVAAGTISGLIFYANIVSVNQSIFFPEHPTLYTRILSVFIAWLNLDLGIETCFYDGLDTYAKTWLQFAFPIYIWFLVGLVIISSRYSSTVARTLGTNPVAVLATLFLLSYVKVLRTILAALSFTDLQYPNNIIYTVWQYDGNIVYLSGRHIPLFVVALVFFLMLFLPYTLLLLLGPCLQARSNWKVLSWINNPRLKILMDAYHGPYRDDYRYWPGLLLVIRFILLLVFSSNTLSDPSVNLFAISTCTIGLLALAWLIPGVYKKRSLEALEAFFILNLSILSVATLYVTRTRGNQMTVANISVSATFAVFIGIVAYHTHLQLRDTQIWKRTWVPASSMCVGLRGVCGRLKLRGYQEIDEEPPEIITEETRLLVPTTVVTVCQREPLIFTD